MIPPKLIHDPEIFFNPEKKEILEQIDRYIINIPEDDPYETLKRAKSVGKLYSAIVENKQELMPKTLKELETQLKNPVPDQVSPLYVELKSTLDEPMEDSTAYKVKQLISRILHEEIEHLNQASDEFLLSLKNTSPHSIGTRIHQLPSLFSIFINLHEESITLNLQKQIQSLIQEFSLEHIHELLSSHKFGGYFLKKLRIKETNSEELKRGHFTILSTISPFHNKPDDIPCINILRAKTLLNEFFTLKSADPSPELETEIDQLILNIVLSLPKVSIRELQNITGILREFPPGNENLIKTISKDLIDSIFVIDSDRVENLELTIQKILILKEAIHNSIEEFDLALKQLGKKLQPYLMKYQKHLESYPEAHPIKLEGIELTLETETPRMRCDSTRYNAEGQDPHYFEEQSKEVVSIGAKIIEKVVPKGLVLNKEWKNYQQKALFRFLLKFFGGERRKIADKQKTPASERFGVWRESRRISLQTKLIGSYQEYGQVIANDLLDRELGISETEVIDELTFSIKTLAIVSEGKPAKRKIYNLQWKEEQPFILSYFNSEMESGLITIHHQAPDLIQYSIEILERYFILTLASDNEEDLKKNIAIFRFIFGHSAPYFRGSAAIAEWFEKAIYAYRGYESSYGEALSDEHFKPTGDLDAYTVTLAEYITLYKERITLRDIE
jgi:hypothetical protein